MVLPEADTNVARNSQQLACANAHELQVYGWMRWKLSEHPTVPTTTRATALECVLSESNPNPRAAVCVSCLMHCCQRPTFSVQRLSKPNRLVSANISTRSCLMRLPAATAEPPRWSSAMVVPSLCARSLLAGALPLWAGSVVVYAVVAWPACD